MLQKEIEVVPKTSISSSSDIEIEIAELLYGLKTSKNHESSSEKPETGVNHHNATVPGPSEDVGGFQFREVFSFTLPFSSFFNLFFSLAFYQRKRKWKMPTIIPPWFRIIQVKS